MKKLIKLRAHHLICNLCFQGNGYNDEFVNNFFQIHNIIKFHQDDKIIKIISSLDEVCQKCPQQNNKHCFQTAKVSDMDAFYLEKLKFHENDIVSYQLVIDHIKRYLTIEDFHQGCRLCAWKEMGICEEVLSNTVWISSKD